MTDPPIKTPQPGPTPTTYPDSLDSSPRSRATDFDDTSLAQPPPTKLRLLCSYGGHILPRPHDKTLSYVGGDTRIIVVDRSVTLTDLLSRLSKTLLNGNIFTVKYQLPNEDLDSLITISTDEDLDNMIDEYDRLVSSSNPSKPGRIRLFLFSSKSGSVDSIGSIQSEDWFLNALNGSGSGAGLHQGLSDPASVNSLLGLDDSGKNGNNNCSSEKLGKVQGVINQEIHSVPDSPIIETTSSFGSTSSSPSLVNLPPIRVHVEEGGAGGGGGGVRVLDQRVVGIEEQFGQLGINGVGGGGVVDEGFGVQTQPGPVLMGGGSGESLGTGLGRVYLDDDGYRKQQTMGVGVVMGQGVGVMPTQSQQKQMSGGGELPSPDSVSSDSSLSNAINRQKPVYQDPATQLSSGSNRFPPNLLDPNTRIQMQQVSDTNYAMPPQFEQHQQQLLQQHQQQYQQQQLGQTQSLPQSQQYIPAGAHFVHHPPAGAIPLSTYYQMYPPQQQTHHHPQYPVYYVPAGQSQAYSLPVQPPNMGGTANVAPSTHPQNPPNPTMITASSAYNQARNVPAPSPEMSGVYRTAGPQLVQVPSSQNQPQAQAQAHSQQQQFMGYSQIHHPSQSIAPSSTANASYAYEFADPGHAQVYYTQPLLPNLASQYQVMNPGTTMGVQDGSSQHDGDNLNQQIRSSQPL